MMGIIFVRTQLLSCSSTNLKKVINQVTTQFPELWENAYFFPDSIALLSPPQQTWDIV
jgi:hypothetical protein